MTEDKKLILIKGEDKTAEVREIKYGYGKAEVTFNNSAKKYFYALSDVKELRLTSILPATNIIVEVDPPNIELLCMLN